MAKSNAALSSGRGKERLVPFVDKVMAKARSRRPAWNSSVSAGNRLSTLGKRHMTIEKLLYRVDGECRIGLMRFAGRGRGLRLETFDLIFLRPRRIAGQFQFGQRPINLLGINGGALLAPSKRRRAIARGLHAIDNCHEFRIRTDCGVFSIVAEACVLLPTR